MSSDKLDATATAAGIVEAGVFTWDLDSDTVYADEVLAELFGFDAAVAQSGQPIIHFLDRIDASDKPRIAQAIHEAIVTGEAYQQDYDILRPDGTRARVSAFGRCFRDATGTPSHYAGIVCPKADERAPQDSLFWHCLQAHHLARQCGQWEMVRHLELALREFGHPPQTTDVVH